MSCGCANGSPSRAETALQLQSRSAWSADLDCGLRAGEMAIQTVANPGPLQVRLLAELNTAQLSSWRVHDVSPTSGAGWIELSSPQAYVAWNIETSQNGVKRYAFHRTGPATRAGMWIERGCVVRCYPVSTVPRTGGANEEFVNPISGVLQSVPEASTQWDITPRASVRFWGGSNPLDLQHIERRQLDYDGLELAATPGSTGSAVYPAGYDASVQCMSSSSWSWDVQTRLAGTTRTYFTTSATRFTTAIGPWSRLVPTIPGGAASYAQLVWMSLPNGQG